VAKIYNDYGIREMKRYQARKA